MSVLEDTIEDGIQVNIITIHVYTKHIVVCSIYILYPHIHSYTPYSTLTVVGGQYHDRVPPPVILIHHVQQLAYLYI